MASDLSVDQHRLVNWPQSIGTSLLRRLNASQLREVDGPMFVLGSVGEKPLAVLVPYALFMEWQHTIFSPCALTGSTEPTQDQETKDDEGTRNAHDGDKSSPSYRVDKSVW